jgi:hypothetical protein
MLTLAQWAALDVDTRAPFVAAAAAMKPEGAAVPYKRKASAGEAAPRKKVRLRMLLRQEADARRRPRRATAIRKRPSRR